MRYDKFRGNVLVANLPPGFTDAKLAEQFDDYGLVLGAFLARDPQTGDPKNYGLVMLAPERSVATAIAELDGTKIDGRRITVRQADPGLSLNVPRPRQPPRPPAPPREARVFQVEYVKSRRRV